MPHPELGEEVGAAVALKPGATVTPDELRSYVKCAGRCLQVPAASVVRRRLAQGPHREDPQARDHRAGCGGYWMTTSTAPSVTPDEAAVLADQAAPLDALLIDAALGPARRFAPDMSTAKLAVALVRQPRRPLPRRLGRLGAEIGPDRDRHVDARARRGATAASPTTAWTSNPLLRRLVQLYLAGGQTAEQLVADADLDWRDEQRMRFSTENLVEAVCAEQRSAGEPGLGQGDYRQRWGELRPRRGATGTRHGVPTAYPGDGRPIGVRGGPQHRHHARRGRAAHRGVRADPVHAADRAGARGAAADRAADDQQVLRARPGARTAAWSSSSSARASRCS